MSEMSNKMTSSFLTFLQNNTTNHLFCIFARAKLISHGFQELNENQLTSCKIPQKGFIIRDNKSIIGFKINGYDHANIVGTLVDAPSLKAKGASSEFKDGDFHMVRLSPNNPSLIRLTSYIDRELKVSGIVLTKDKKIYEICSKNPVGIIPNISSEIANTGCYDSEIVALIGKKGLRELIADHIKCSPDDIIDYDLEFGDCEKPVMVNDDVIYASKLTYYGPAYAALMGFLKETTNTKDNVQFFVGFGDITNTLRCSAESEFFDNIFETIFRGKDINEIKSKSLFAYVLGVEGQHPRYINLRDCLSAKFNKGVVLYQSNRYQYQTDVIGEALLNNIKKIQKQTHKNTQILSQELSQSISLNSGIRTVDIGIPVLSSGSSRETMFYKDVLSCLKFVHLLLTDA